MDNSFEINYNLDEHLHSINGSNDDSKIEPINFSIQHEDL